MISTLEFEKARPRLLSVAYRILGSAYDAEDAVQTAWLRTQSVRGSGIENPTAWLTTVVSSICLDQLRERRRRHALTEQVLAEDPRATPADEDMLHREDVSRALLVLLGELTPAQRVAYVLHDLFSVPFDDVAAVLGVTPPAAKKHASRARARIRPAPPERLPHNAGRDHREIVDAFLHAARGGDTARMIALLAPDCVRHADAALLPGGAAVTVRGAAAIAQETHSFAARIGTSTPMRVDGRVVDVIASGGHPLAVIDFRTHRTVVVMITIRAVRATDRFAAV